MSAWLVRGPGRVLADWLVGLDWVVAWNEKKGREGNAQGYTCGNPTRRASFSFPATLLATKSPRLMLDCDAF